MQSAVDDNLLYNANVINMTRLTSYLNYVKIKYFPIFFSIEGYTLRFTQQIELTLWKFENNKQNYIEYFKACSPYCAIKSLMFPKIR